MIRAGHPESRVLNCPLFEVGTPPPHNSDMAYGLETGNNIAPYIYICVENVLRATQTRVIFNPAERRED